MSEAIFSRNMKRPEVSNEIKEYIGYNQSKRSDINIALEHALYNSKDPIQIHCKCMYYDGTPITKNDSTILSNYDPGSTYPGYTYQYCNKDPGVRISRTTYYPNGSTGIKFENVYTTDNGWLNFSAEPCSSIYITDKSCEIDLVPFSAYIYTHIYNKNVFINLYRNKHTGEYWVNFNTPGTYCVKISNRVTKYTKFVKAGEGRPGAPAFTFNVQFFNTKSSDGKGGDIRFKTSIEYSSLWNVNIYNDCNTLFSNVLSWLAGENGYHGSWEHTYESRTGWINLNIGSIGDPMKDLVIFKNNIKTNENFVINLKSYANDLKGNDGKLTRLNFTGYNSYIIRSGNGGNYGGNYPGPVVDHASDSNNQIRRYYPPGNGNGIEGMNSGTALFTLNKTGSEYSIALALHFNDPANGVQPYPWYSDNGFVRFSNFTHK